MLGIGLGEFLALAVVAMIVLGPEKLPRYAAEAARFLRNLRRMADAARADVRRELGPEFDNIGLSDLNPRTMVRRHLLEPIDLEDLDDPGDGGRRTPQRSRGRAGQKPRAATEQRSGRSPGRAGTPEGAPSAAPADAAADGAAGERLPYDPDAT